MKLPIAARNHLAEIAMKLQVQILRLVVLNELHINFHGCEFRSQSRSQNLHIFFSEGFCSPVVQKDKIWSLHRTLVRPAPTPQTGAKQQSEIRRIIIGQK